MEIFLSFVPSFFCFAFGYLLVSSLSSIHALRIPEGVAMPDRNVSLGYASNDRK